MRLKPVAAILLSVVMAGCAVQPQTTPVWLEEIKKLECSATVNAACLSRAIEGHLAASASKSSFGLSAALHYVAAAEVRGSTWSLPADLQVERRALFTEFSAVIKMAITGDGVAAIKAAKKLPDDEAKQIAIFFIATISIRNGNAEPASAALEELLAGEPTLYRLAMNQQLEAVIVTGDLEKAYAMRLHLLETLDRREANIAQDINDLALVYARTGLIADLTDWISKVVRSIPDLANGDEAILRAILVQAAVGNPPAVDTLSSLKRHEARLTAYLELARLYRLLGNQELEKRAIQDAVLFSQVSSLRVDRAIVAEYLSLMWLEAIAPELSTKAVDNHVNKR